MKLPPLTEKMPLESYVIGKVIGKGSYGEVCLVKHRKDRKQVSFVQAWKRFTPALISVVYGLCEL